MDMFRNNDGWEQKLMLTFHARSLDMDEIVEDVTALAPSARFGCAGDTEAPAEAPGDLVHVAMELPDDSALLNRVTAVIFHAQGSLQPGIKVQRVLSRGLAKSPNGAMPCRLRGGDAIAAAA
jgi:hypothetical protein